VSRRDRSGVSGRLQVVVVPLSGLRPWERNPRTITPAGLAELQRSLAADPLMLWARPLIALLDGTVICGNQRLLAALALGWTEIQVVFVDLEPDRAAMWALRDNNAWADWDEPALAELLAELNLEGLDLLLTGFTSAELDCYLGLLAQQADPDDAPPLSSGEPSSKPGELYELGAHRVFCGDARDSAVLAALFGDELASLLLTDAPYGVEYQGKTRRGLRIENDGAEGLLSLLTEAFGAADRVLEPNAPFYLFAPAGPQGMSFRIAIDQAGWKLHQCLVWVKNAIVLGHSDHHFQHEDVLYGWKPGPGRPGRGRHAGSRWYGDNRQSTVLFADRPARSEDHPTMKPVGLLEPMISHSSRRGEIVFDPFSGSGSTLVACERLGRRCFAVELDPRYCDVIRARYREVHGG
jgi:DNA modification methylase